MDHISPDHKWWRPEGAVQARMEDNRTTRIRQDIPWETSTPKELGAGALLGPNVSPKKRGKEQG